MTVKRYSESDVSHGYTYTQRLSISSGITTRLTPDVAAYLSHLPDIGILRFPSGAEPWTMARAELLPPAAAGAKNCALQGNQEAPDGRVNLDPVMVINWFATQRPHLLLPLYLQCMGQYVNIETLLGQRTSHLHQGAAKTMVNRGGEAFFSLAPVFSLLTHQSKTFVEAVRKARIETDNPVLWRLNKYWSSLLPYLRAESPSGLLLPWQRIFFYEAAGVCSSEAIRLEFGNPEQRPTDLTLQILGALRPGHTTVDS